jgi:hypothetical protein
VFTLQAVPRLTYFGPWHLDLLKLGVVVSNPLTSRKWHICQDVNGVGVLHLFLGGHRYLFEYFVLVSDVNLPSVIFEDSAFRCQPDQ